MKYIHLLYLICGVLAYVPPVQAADLVLVANRNAGIARLSEEDVTNIFMGRYRRYAAGRDVEPLDLPTDSPLKARFYRQLVGKSLAEINAYWSRLIFSGKTQPPRVAATPEEALQLVLQNPTTLAYVEKQTLDPRLAIVFELKD